MNTNEIIDRYLNELCWAMGGSFSEQQAVRDELRSHINDAIREHELVGSGSEDALSATLHDLGDPSKLGRSMRSSRGTGPLRRPLVQPDGAIILEPRRNKAMPSLPVMLALGGGAVASLAVVVAYAWP